MAFFENLCTIGIDFIESIYFLRPTTRQIACTSRMVKGPTQTLPYRIIVDFVIDTIRAGGATLFDEEDEIERSRTEKGIVHCIQVAPKVYRKLQMHADSGWDRDAALLGRDVGAQRAERPREEPNEREQARVGQQSYCIAVLLV
ncbi:hypothetical protein Y032_0631g864 [Ancylostoma ceylanicum]|nr:hypothetical protein Y032_0631g864 [Ancylostoma ceylanicum]